VKPLRTFGLFATLIASVMPESTDAQDGFALRRAEMVAEIAAMARGTGAETGRPVWRTVMAALGRQRHLLVPRPGAVRLREPPLSSGTGRLFPSRTSSP
jgi:hypothetical protein